MKYLFALLLVIGVVAHPAYAMPPPAPNFVLHIVDSSGAEQARVQSTIYPVGNPIFACDGHCSSKEIYLPPGMYEVKIGQTIFKDIEIKAGQKTEKVIRYDPPQKAPTVSLSSRRKKNPIASFGITSLFFGGTGIVIMFLGILKLRLRNKIKRISTTAISSLQANGELVEVKGEVVQSGGTPLKGLLPNIISTAIADKRLRLDEKSRKILRIFLRFFTFTSLSSPRFRYESILGNSPLIAPLSKQECVYYSLKIVQGKGDSRGTLVSETKYVPFWISDGSASVLINPENAKLNLKQKLHGSAGGLGGKEMPEALTQLLNERKIRYGGLLGMATLYFTEYFIPLKETLYALGGTTPFQSDTMSTPPKGALTHAMIQKTKRYPRVFISDQNEEKLLSGLRTRGALELIGGLLVAGFGIGISGLLLVLAR